MAQTERSITKAIMRHLKGRGAWVVKLHGGPFQAAGLPDILCILDGRTMFFEVKTETGAVTKIQAYCHKRIRKAGGLVAVVRGANQVQYLINNFGDNHIWSMFHE